MNLILKCRGNSVGTCCVCKQRSSGWPSMSAETVVFCRLICKVEGNWPSTCWMCHRQVCGKVCRNSLLFSCTDCKCCSTQQSGGILRILCVHGLYCGRWSILVRICVSGNGTQQPCVKFNTHNVCVWGSGNPRAVVKHVRDSLGLRALMNCANSLLLGKQFMELSTTVAWSSCG
jgi:hypothetical protein